MLKDKKIIIRAIEMKDLPSVLSLLKSFRLPTEYVIDNAKNFVVAEYKNKIIGCGCLSFYDDVVEIRAVAVKKRFQRLGIGSHIVKKLLNFAHDKGIKSMYLRTLSHSKTFFLEFGFKELPQKILCELFDDCKNCDRYTDLKCTTIPMVLNLKKVFI